MEPSDEKLKRLRGSLIRGLNIALINDLVDEMLSVKVINESERGVILDTNTTTRDRARTLIDIVKQKGARASELFIEALKELDETLSTNLKLNDTSASVSQALPPPTLPLSAPVTSHQWIRQSSETFYNTKSGEKDEVYEILPKVSRTRLALIINNVEFENPDMRRLGADVDQRQMEKLLEGFGYKVETANNLSAQEMEKRLSGFSQQPEHQGSDSAFVVVMSHGLRDKICGRGYGGDGEDDSLHTDKIFNALNNQRCHGLRGKPKIIIIQACRGGERGHVFVSDSASPADPQPPTDQQEDAPCYKVHKESDFICFCSSTPDTVSWRDKNKGTIFIQKLVEVMRVKACEEHIEELFSKVQREFKDDKRQLPAKERSTLMKKFYLFPGF